MFGFGKHCSICGVDVAPEGAIRRFGKYFCSDSHAEIYTSKRLEREASADKESSRGGCC